MIQQTGSYSFKDFPARTKRIETKALTDVAKMAFDTEWPWVRRVLGRKKHAVAVDLGSGTGDGARRLAERFPGTKVYAFEPNASLHRTAKRRHSGVGNLILRKIVPGHLAECGESWVDLVSIRLVLQHCADPVAELNHIYRVLKPGGAVLIFDGYVQSMSFYPDDQVLRTTWEKILSARSMQGGDPNIGIKLPSLLRQIGFEHTEICRTSGGLELASDKNIGYFLNRWSYILSRDQQEQCARALTDYLERHGTTGACYSGPSFSTFFARKPK